MFWFRSLNRRPPAFHARRSAAWLRLFPQAGLACCGIAALRFVEALVVLPWRGGPSVIAIALLAGRTYWLAGAMLGAITLVARVIRRGSGPPAVIRPPPPMQPPTREMQVRGWGFDVVAGWVVMSILVLVVMSDTGTGPFAWLAIRVFGVRAFAGPVTFLLGLPAFSAPLVLLAVLPRHTRWPLVAGVQAAVKPAPQARQHRRRR